MSEWELLGRVALAAVLAGFIGFDREALQKPAGIRTHMLVGAGAALFSATSILILGEAALVEGRGDAVRIPAAIVTGVGFLGAGAILRTGDRVTGMTTAAGIWVTAAIGLAVGSGFWIIGVGSTVLVLVITYGVAGISEWIDRRHPSTSGGPRPPRAEAGAAGTTVTRDGRSRRDG